MYISAGSMSGSRRSQDFFHKLKFSQSSNISTHPPCVRSQIVHSRLQPGCDSRTKTAMAGERLWRSMGCESHHVTLTTQATWRAQRRRRHSSVSGLHITAILCLQSAVVVESCAYLCMDGSIPAERRDLWINWRCLTVNWWKCASDLWHQLQSALPVETQLALALARKQSLI